MDICVFVQKIQIYKFSVSNETNCHPLEVLGRGSETQLQVGDNLIKTK